MNLKDTTLILPTLNEEENLSLLLNFINKSYPDIKITIVDDGSKDKTKNIALHYSKKNQNIIFIDRKKEKIKGICISVIEAIKKTKTKYFIVMDTDLQHPPEKIKEIRKNLNAKNELVIATRGEIKKWQVQRKLMSKIANYLAKITLFTRRKKIPRDPLSGFFGGETIIFQEIINKNYRSFELKGYKILFDLLKILPSDTKIKEIPYSFNERKKGESKIETRHIFYFLKSLFK